MSLNQPLPQLPKNLLGQLLGLPVPKRKKTLAALSPVEALSMLYDWRIWAREAQLPPEWLKWRVCIMLGGRGSGKTRAGAEWVRMMIETGKARRISLVAPTAADARDVMVEGESGILAVCPPWDRPDYEPSKRRVTWKNGAVATLYTADEPSRLRGPQSDAAWCDELAFWRYPEAWDNLLLGLRLGGPDGDAPRCVVTTTPRPSALIKDLLKRDSTHLLRSTTFDNEANLAAEFIEDIIERYEGTRLGRQELYAELLTDTEGALWTRDIIENFRVSVAPPLKRIVVAVDPAVSSGETSNHTGIVVAGIAAASDGDHCYVLEDATIKASPAQWAARAVECYLKHKADRIVAESNQGGEMVRHTIATVNPRVPIKLVHATRGKFTRAEPVAALYEQGKVHHVNGFPKLEDQLCTWTIDEPSPDRLDALVWAVSELCLNKPGNFVTF